MNKYLAYQKKVERMTLMEELKQYLLGAVAGAAIGIAAGMYVHHSYQSHALNAEVKQVRHLLEDRRDNILVLKPEVAAALGVEYDEVGMVAR